MKLTLGIDVGNSDVKSSNTTFASGYNSYSKKPAMANKYLFYNGEYYIPSLNRKAYREDKTEDGRCIIFTLMSIGEEILNSYKKLSPQEKQAKIDKITAITLGVGLPPADMTGLKARTEKYYQDELSGIVEFEYNGYHFAFRLQKVYVFPQNYSATVTCKSSKIIGVYSKYYVVDIGGITVDIICMEDNQPIVEDVDSKEIGMLNMCEYVIKKVKQETHVTIDQKNIESVLRKQPNALKEDVIDSIMDGCYEWSEKILDELSQCGIKFESYPVVFMGGGSKALKPFFERSNKLGVHEYMLNVHANARGYELLAKGLDEQGR